MVRQALIRLLFMKRLPLFLAMLIACAALQAQSFLTPRDVDLVRLLPPPPLDDSEQTRIELAEVLSIQATRTPAMEALARADSEESPWRFTDVVGAKFTKESLPRLALLFKRLHETEGAIVDPAKERFNRPRPYRLSDQVHPIAKISKSSSYPSGHATGGTLMGIVLSDMLPEKREVIMARAWQYGSNRVTAGVHYRSDIEAGRIAGSVIAQVLFMRDDFRAELDAARKELRTLLALDPAAH
jgi:acid phosphatase (class A)